MKRYLPLTCILIAAVAAIYVAQRRKVSTRPNSQAILSVVADTESQVSRIPSSLDRLSDTDEIAIGNRLAAEYTAQEKNLGGQKASAAAVERYIQSVGATVVVHARRKLPYRFHYVAEPSFVNAFSLPGGHVFVGEGLLRLMPNEDALAAVLGHEIEHIDLGHCAQRIQMERRMRNLGTIGELASLPIGVFTAGYSKSQELEADRYGAALAVAASYSPVGILQLLDRFRARETQDPNHDADSSASPVDEAAQLSIQTLQDYLQSHPPSAERKRQLELAIREEHWPEPPTRPLRYP